MYLSYIKFVDRPILRQCISEMLGRVAQGEQCATLTILSGWYQSNIEEGGGRGKRKKEKEKGKRKNEKGKTKKEKGKKKKEKGKRKNEKGKWKNEKRKRKRENEELPHIRNEESQQHLFRNDCVNWQNCSYK